MAAKGRGSAIAMLLMLVVVLQYEMSSATTYIVGGKAGWTFNVVGWPSGKRFRAGDVLVFNYSPTLHNVVAVSKAGYDTCIARPGAPKFQTGKDKIKLAKGPNYFICTFPGHCQGGMKIAVTAA